MKILVAISGGVDSAVAAHILKSQGHSITGAMMKIYSGKSNGNALGSCYGTDKSAEIADAKKYCDFIGCDFHLVDVSDEFDKLVFTKFKSEYLNARTPNPCVLCNPLIKFGAFPNKLMHMGIAFDKFATGHYVRCEFDSDIGKYKLLRGVNHKKDQSYFLYALTQEKLSKIIFPLGTMDKEDVRKYALEHNIPVALKRDSQDFYSGSYSDLFDESVECGDIVDTFGNVLGKHRGLCNYTIGQRKGLFIAYSEPLYVVGFDKKNNRLIVSTKDDTYAQGLIASNANWILDIPHKKFDAQVKIRSSQQPFNCLIYPSDDGVRVLFDTPQSAVAPGQAAVFYQGDTVLGGATITSSIKA